MISLATVILIVLLILAHYTPLLDSLIQRLTAATEGDTTVAFTGRNQVWTAAFTIIFRNPLNFLFGVGPGMFGDTVSYYQLTDLTRGIKYVHNTLLSFFVEFGFFYAVWTLLLLLVGVLYLLRRLIRGKENYALGFLWGYITIFIFMNSVTYQYSRMAYVYIVFAMVSLYRMQCGELKDPIPTVPATNPRRVDHDLQSEGTLGKGMTDQ